MLSWEKEKKIERGVSFYVLCPNEDFAGVNLCAMYVCICDVTSGTHRTRVTRNW